MAALLPIAVAQMLGFTTLERAATDPEETVSGCLRCEEIPATRNYVLLRVLALVSLAVSLVGCDQTAAKPLAARCDRIYREAADELETAIKRHDLGEPAEAIIREHSSRIEELTKDIRGLRHDLAEGGERHQWPWPPYLRSQAIIRYEVRLGNHIGDASLLAKEKRERNYYALAELPEALQVLGRAARNDLKATRWFCNRAVAATLPDVPEETTNFDYLWRVRTQSVYDTEILRQVQTDEEAAAFKDYLLWRATL